MHLKVNFSNYFKLNVSNRLLFKFTRDVGNPFIDTSRHSASSSQITSGTKGLLRLQKVVLTFKSPVTRQTFEFNYQRLTSKTDALSCFLSFNHLASCRVMLKKHQF